LKQAIKCEKGGMKQRALVEKFKYS